MKNGIKIYVTSAIYRPDDVVEVTERHQRKWWQFWKPRGWTVVRYYSALNWSQPSVDQD